MKEFGYAQGASHFTDIIVHMTTYCLFIKI